LVSPANNATGIATNPTLTWNASTGAVTYRLQVATDANFTALVFNDSTLTTTSKQLSGLNNSTKYYWRVNAKNTAGTSAYSDVWNFTTVSGGGLAFDIPVGVTDGTTLGTVQLRFGLAPDATDGIDTQYGEAPLPPMPPAGIFDGRFNLPVNNESSLKDYRQGTAAFSGQKVHEIQYQVGTGTTITVNWAMPAGVQGRLQDVVLGTIIDVQMVGTGNYTVTNPGTFNKLKMTITYGAPVIPTVPVLVSPANNSTGVALNPTLKWNKSTGALTYRLQVATDANFTAIIFNDSTLVDTMKQLSGLGYNTPYFWRVNAKNAAGTSAYSDVWKFTTMTEPVLPGVPVLVSPANNATGIVLSPMLKWNKSTNAVTYRLQVATDANFTAVVFNDSTLTDTLKQLSGLSYNTKYYWRVNAKNPTGTSNWSTVFNFTTETPPPVPSTPILASPANNATNQTASPFLKWYKAQYAVTYQLQVATDQNFTTMIFNDSTLTDSVKQVFGLSLNTTYYWRVKAKNAVGSSAFSSVWNFKTVAQPVVAMNLPFSITDNAGGMLQLYAGLSLAATNGLDTLLGEFPLPPLPPTGVFDARFNLPVGNESSLKDYRQGDTNSIVTTIHEVQYQVGSGTSITINWVLPQRVNGRLQDIVTGALIDVPMSGTGSYTVTNPGVYNKLKMTLNYIEILPPPPAPVLVSPANGAVNVLTNVTFKWNKSQYASFYRLLVSKNSLFTQIVLNDSTITDTMKYVTGLENNIKYYWRVIARNSFGVSPNSMTFNFTTVPPVPAVPTLWTPANNAVKQPLAVTLGWSPVTLATVYHVQLIIDSTTFVVNDSLVTDTTKAVSGLKEVTQYLWRVRAGNAAGYGPYPAWFNFKTVLNAPDSLKAVAVGKTLKVNLTWKNNSLVSPVFNIERKTATGTYSVIKTTAAGATTFTDSVGLASGNYVYRVVAVKGADTSAYSNEATTPVSVREVSNLTPDEFALAQNYPNPFNPSTKIEYSLPVESKVVLEVYSTLGEKVATLFSGTQNAGVYEATFDARNLNSGLYIVRMEAKSAAQNFVQVRKMIFMK
jgi:hypothetical protein